MIAMVAAVIGGLIMGLKIPLLAPVIYLSISISKFRKALLLILFFFSRSNQYSKKSSDIVIAEDN